MHHRFTKNSRYFVVIASASYMPYSNNVSCEHSVCSQINLYPTRLDRVKRRNDVLICLCMYCICNSYRFYHQSFNLLIYSFHVRIWRMNVCHRVTCSAPISKREQGFVQNHEVYRCIKEFCFIDDKITSFGQ